MGPTLWIFLNWPSGVPDDAQEYGFVWKISFVVDNHFSLKKGYVIYDSTGEEMESGIGYGGEGVVGLIGEQVGFDD